MNIKQSDPIIRRIPFSKDSGVGERARIGLLVLESDQTIEEEFRILTALPGVSIYHARLKNEAEVTTEMLSGMEEQLPIAARLIPSYLGIKSIGYGCTSGATIIGENRVESILNDAHNHVPSTNPLSAAKAAFKILGVKRLGLITPYSPNITSVMQNNFNEANLPVTIVGSYFEESDINVGRIDEESIFNAVSSVGMSDSCDGVFISCTSLRAARIIEKAEKAINKPVTASNHALAWHLLRLAGIKDTLSGFGSLFKL